METGSRVQSVRDIIHSDLTVCGIYGDNLHELEGAPFTFFPEERERDKLVLTGERLQGRVLSLQLHPTPHRTVLFLNVSSSAMFVSDVTGDPKSKSRVLSPRILQILGIAFDFRFLGPSSTAQTPCRLLLRRLASTKEQDPNTPSDVLVGTFRVGFHTSL